MNPVSNCALIIFLKSQYILVLYLHSNWASVVIVFQAIKLNPADAETYYQRAAMFKMVTYFHCFSTDMSGLCKETSLLLKIPRLEWRHWNRATTNQTQYTNLCKATSSVWNVLSRMPDFSWARKNEAREKLCAGNMIAGKLKRAKRGDSIRFPPPGMGIRESLERSLHKVNVCDNTEKYVSIDDFLYSLNRSVWQRFSVVRRN